MRGRHHTLLHSYSGLQGTEQGAANNPIEGATHEKAVHTSSKLVQSNNPQVLLATALIKVTNSQGYCILLRALLDQGSEATFISHAAALRLRLRGNNTDVRIKGVGGSEMTVAKRAVQFTIGSRYNPSLQLPVEAFVLPRLTGLLPSRHISSKLCPQLEDLFLADPTYFQPGRIDILIGADIYAQVIEEGIRKGPDGAPLAQLTSLGWILSGRFENQQDFKLERNAFTSLHTQINLDSLVRRFWEIEEGPAQSQLTEEETTCEEIYRTTVKRQHDGRYIVRLPFNTDNRVPQLGESREIAVQQLMQIERRLEGNHELSQQYTDFMIDYHQQGHMEIVSQQMRATKANYLPHHFVIKESSTTTKLRVVFDASRKTSNKKSLNDNVLVGPTVQEDLFTILSRWRKHRIAFSADIKQMYRQILVDERDADFQRIVWRCNKDDPMLEFRLRTVTYGTSCAPYLATRTLLQLANDEAEGYPDASNILRHDFYVDDVLSGGDTITEVLQTQRELRLLLKQGCFELRKWVSNRQEVLEGVSAEERELNLPFDITKDISIKALGIYWDPVKDIFSYKVNNIEYAAPTTKRGLLSSIARIFDPLGWLAPIIVTGKLLLQDLWTQGLDWDARLPSQLELQWMKYCISLKDIEKIQIARWIHTTKESRAFELHVFSDASFQAYGACVYSRVTAEDGTIHTNLLTAKTKVAPIKAVSLPRLELCGALLGSKLVKNIARALNIPNTQIHSWTDSQIVLACVRSHPRHWKQFVSNRVAEIQNILQDTRWNYVPSKENPADCASRGLQPLQLKEHHIWWSGPSWLQKERNEWPNTGGQGGEDMVTHLGKEAKRARACVTTLDKGLSLVQQYSSYSKLIRIAAYCKRFYNNLRASRTGRKLGHLKVKELQEAEKVLIKLTQKESFHDEISSLAGNKQLRKSSKILNLNPFLDNEGLLRVGGRLRNSNLSFHEMCPIILPGDNHFSRLLVEELHQTTLHGGIQLMLNVLRKTYWVLNARNLTKKVIHNCITCFRFTAKTRTQLMGDLPASRVRPSRPFANTGVDFAGPVEIKARTGRGRIQTTKGYIALFICLSTKAIHLEAVSDLSANAFLAAFKRFTGRRGLCQQLYSDCGTNFVGASKKLSAEYQSFFKSISPEIISTLTNQRVTWHFIPPASPHFGGLWEAGVRSMKYHLRRIIKNVKLTFEELSTVLVQVEACLNSRPLCPLTDDPNDCAVLTPGHFIIGNALLTPPESCLIDVQPNYVTRWQLLQQTYQDFWKTWSREYLSRLQQRPKWLNRQPNVRVGDLVLVKDENVPPARWVLATIEETHPGSDGLVRVVTLKCKGALFKRPIIKICPLPSNEVSLEGQDQTTLHKAQGNY